MKSDPPPFPHQVRIYTYIEYILNCIIKTDPPPLPYQIGSLVHCSHVVRVTTLLRVDAWCDVNKFKVPFNKATIYLIISIYLYIYSQATIYLYI